MGKSFAYRDRLALVRTLSHEARCEIISWFEEPCKVCILLGGMESYGIFIPMVLAFIEDQRNNFTEFARRQISQENIEHLSAFILASIQRMYAGTHFARDYDYHRYAFSSPASILSDFRKWVCMK